MLNPPPLYPSPFPSAREESAGSPNPQSPSKVRSSSCQDLESRLQELGGGVIGLCCYTSFLRDQPQSVLLMSERSNLCAPRFVMHRRLGASSLLLFSIYLKLLGPGVNQSQVCVSLPGSERCCGTPLVGSGG